MSHYSVLNTSDIIEIINQYEILNLESYVLLSGGSENTNYLVRAENKQFVLTICEQKSLEDSMNLAYLLEHLAKHNFETSKVVRSVSEELIATWNGKPVMLKIFLNGEIMDNLPNPIIENLGIEIGKLHLIAPPSYLPKVLSYGQEYFHEARQYAPDSSFEKWITEIHNYLCPYFTNDLPKALIHSDIFYSNVIVSQNRQSACIMDFEEAANYYRIFDIGMTIVGLCSEMGKVNLEKMGHLLKGYQQIIELHEAEKIALQAFTVYAAAAMTFWRHRNFNHTNPNPVMYNHYLGLKVIADFVKNLPEEVFLDFLK